ncbi:MAG: N-acetylglucosaminyl-diphospho-decaprenol L-rhamnosyltransferase, partial [Solirubrobacterales bacterium]|nr:N-acetylglucosaminyl-diphospho-decaprenol L-rhamnosyltransferase [Solirubrobacterales bacterium]
RDCLMALAGSGVLLARMPVVDNASIDESAEIAAELGCRVVRQAANTGFAAACNVGLVASTEPYVLIANPDALVDPGAVAVLVAAATAHDDGFAFAPVLRPHSRLRSFSTLGSDLAGMTPRRLAERFEKQSRDRPAPSPASAPVPVDYAEGALLLLDRRRTAELGGFDEAFFLYSEEEDLCRRAAARLWRTYVVPSATASHAESRSSAGASASRLAPFRLRSRYLYYRRHRGRIYAEWARLVLGILVALNRASHTIRASDSPYPPETLRVLFRARWTDRYKAILAEAAS